MSDRTVNIEQLEAHVMSFDFGDSRKVRSFKSRFDCNSCKYVVKINVINDPKQGDDCEYTLPIGMFGIFNPIGSCVTRYYAKEIKNFIQGNHSMIWQRHKSK